MNAGTVSILVVGLLLPAAGGCTTAQPLATGPGYRPTGTIREIMRAMVDPSADGVWQSVSTTIDAGGTHETAPRTDEEWAEVRRHAIILMESTNLLLVPDRLVAHPGEKSEDPQLMLAPEVIESLVNQDRASWTMHVHQLHDAAASTLRAIDTKDTAAVFAAGGVLYEACEKCHLKYWYPDEAKRWQQ